MKLPHMQKSTAENAVTAGCGQAGRVLGLIGLLAGGWVGIMREFLLLCWFDACVYYCIVTLCSFTILHLCSGCMCAAVAVCLWLAMKGRCGGVGWLLCLHLPLTPCDIAAALLLLVG